MDPTNRKRLVDDVFVLTGKKLEMDDPLVVAALYYSHVMQEASAEVSTRLSAAAQEIMVAAQHASTVNASIQADKAKLLREVEIQVAKGVRAGAKARSATGSFSHVPIKYAIAGAMGGAVALATLFYFGVETVAERERQASIGRAFSRSVQTLDPKLRQQLLDHVEKHR